MPCSGPILRSIMLRGLGISHSPSITRYRQGRSRPRPSRMTCGVIVPVDAMLLDEVFEEVLGRIRGEADAIANDRRFAMAIYRRAVLEGLMDQVGLIDPS